MAHNIKIKVRPHTNKDGTPSKTKKDYVVVDRHRGKVVEVGVETTKKGAEALVDVRRRLVIQEHMRNHPNDRAFMQKHGLVEIQKEN